MLIIYCLAALPCAVVGISSRQRLWLGLALGLVLLGVGRVIGLATVMTQFGRHLAFREGWYQERRPLQAMVILGIVGLTTTLAAAIKRRTSGTRAADLLALMSFLGLLCLIIIRTISLHYIDYLLNAVVAGLKLGGLLELAALLLISLAGMARLYPGRRVVRP